MSIYLRGGAGGVEVPERSVCVSSRGKHPEPAPATPGQSPIPRNRCTGSPGGRAAPVRVPGDDRIYLTEERRQFR